MFLKITPLEKLLMEVLKLYPKEPLTLLQVSGETSFRMSEKFHRFNPELNHWLIIMKFKRIYLLLKKNSLQLDYTLVMFRHSSSLLLQNNPKNNPKKFKLVRELVRRKVRRNKNKNQRQHRQSSKQNKKLLIQRKKNEDDIDHYFI